MTPKTHHGAPRKTPLGQTLARVLTAAALFGLAAPTSGAQLLPLAAPLPQTQPQAPLAVVVDAQTGKVLHVGPQSERGALPQFGGTSEISTSMCFDNADLSGAIGAPPVDVEVVDWGVKGCVGTGFVTRLAIGYATTALDPSVGGPGAEFSFAIYEGTAGFGVLGTERARFDLVGLPGSTVAGQSVTVSLFLDFGNTPLVLPDGMVGWGFLGKDGLTGPLLATAPNAALGTQDLLDLYSPGPAQVSNYVTTAPPIPGGNTGSIALQIEELDPSPAAETTIDVGNGTNPVVFSQLQHAVVGDSWVGEIDLTGFPGAVLTAVGVSEGAYTPAPTAFGELLVNPLDPGFFLDVGFGLHAQQLLPRVTLVGRTFRAQGAVLLSPSGLQFTNALVVSTGF